MVRNAGRILFWTWWAIAVVGCMILLVGAAGAQDNDGRMSVWRSGGPSAWYTWDESGVARLWLECQPPKPGNFYPRLVVALLPDAPRFFLPFMDNEGDVTFRYQYHNHAGIHEEEGAPLTAGLRGLVIVDTYNKYGILKNYTEGNGLTLLFGDENQEVLTFVFRRTSGIGGKCMVLAKTGEY